MIRKRNCVFIVG